MRRMRKIGVITVVAAAAGVVATIRPILAEQIHRQQFSSRQTALIRGEANVRADVLAHEVSPLAFRSQPSSEHIRLHAEVAAGENAFIHFYYPTPPAPVNELLSASVWVKATRGGIQLRARVVFPKEPDPANPQAPLTMLLLGETYPAEKARRWWPLKLQDVPRLLSRQLPMLQARVGRQVNTSGAYIDRLVLNVYAGPGTVEIWIDDLDIGPVQADRPAGGGIATAHGRNAPALRRVEQSGGQLRVDGQPLFFRAIRHSGTPLHVLRQAGFDTLWLPPDASEELLEEAGRDGWLVIATLPLTPERAAGDAWHVDRLAAELAPVLRRYGQADVLFYDLGGGRTRADYERVERTCQAVRVADPRRPQGVNVWDGLPAYSAFLDVVGVHRWPLYTNLELSGYRDWLAQRRELAAPRAIFWTWVQNHLPDWFIETVLEQPSGGGFVEPVGPQPEQVRLLAYLAVASGCQGLGFWSDRFLADSHQGRDRLQALALLNCELEMLSPLLLAPRDTYRTQWLRTSHPQVQAALIRTERGVVVVPIWLGPGSQFVPAQGAVANLKIVVPLVPDGADPWRITPAGVECLAHHTHKVVGGTELTLPEFDLAVPIVFTSDRLGLVAWWQDYARKYGRLAARWAMDQAAVSYDKVQTVYRALQAQGAAVRDAEELFEQAARFHAQARRYFSAEVYDKAYLDAQRSLRPLRVLMHACWRQATATLDTPTASPYAVSFFTLPRHWELARRLHEGRFGPNRLPHGDFEWAETIPPGGLSIATQAGWTARFGTADAVEAAAGVVPAEQVSARPETTVPLTPLKGLFRSSRPLVARGEPATPTPPLGRGMLRLEVRRRVSPEEAKKTLPPLERTFLAVDSPTVTLPPGSWVRISAWFRIPQPLHGSPDGLLFFDDAAGEALGLRLTHLPNWQQFHLYRKVPADGRISVTVALTAAGVAYCDDLRIEPLLSAADAPAGGVVTAVTARTPTAAAGPALTPGQNPAPPLRRTP